MQSPPTPTRDHRERKETVMTYTDFNTGRMTYELAAKLREHKYPQPDDDELRNRPRRWVLYLDPIRSYGPTIGELTAALSTERIFKDIQQENDDWRAVSADGSFVTAPSMLEALVKLWCMHHPTDEGW